MAGEAKAIASELELIERDLSSIRQELVRFDPYGDRTLSAEGADHVIERLGAVESLVNQSKKRANDAKRKAMTNA